MLRSSARRKIPSYRCYWGHRRRLSTGLNASVSPPITAVEKIIIDGIKATGPISFATYMQMCLSHPTQGYYMNPSNPIFGAKGDFVTSPEISGVFGELVGVWLMAQWMQTTEKRLPIRIVELGPGRGTLMHDILRVAAQFGGSHLKKVHLVETSPTLRALQDARLAPSAEKYGCTLEWHDSVEQIRRSEEEYTMVVAHEFFDALPFHVIEKTEKGWQEILIALAESSPAAPSPPSQTDSAPPDSDATAEPAPLPEPYPRFRYVLAPHPTAASTLLGMSSPRFRDPGLPVGTRLEVSPVGFRTMRAVGELISGESSSQSPEAFVVGVDPSSQSSEVSGGDAHGKARIRTRGCGLIVDYGASRAFGQSFRAFKNHSIVDVFHAPGECDLTANVDFAYLKEAVGGLVPTHGPISQAAFLEGMGLQQRVGRLVTDARNTNSHSDAERIREAARRLVDRAGMGSEYKVLGIGGVPHEEEGVVWPFVREEEGAKVV